MRVNGSSNFSDNSLIKLKGQDWLEKQRVAGKVAAGAISLLVNFVKEKTDMTLLEMSEAAEKYIIENGCSPTFKGYKGHGNKEFPAAVCISVDSNVNNVHQLVHGVPGSYKLTDGDLVSFDLGATFESAIGDTATTVIYGEANPEYTRLINAAKECLKKAINVAKVGNHIGEIGNAIYKCAKGYGYNVVIPYGGHGIDWKTPHTGPFIANRALPTEGVRIQPGLTIAIEPLLTLGSPETWVDRDGWSVNCQSISCHHEHTIYIHEDHTEIITKRTDEN